MRDGVSCITGECLRLGVLAFVTIIAFRIPCGSGQSREDVEVKPGTRDREAATILGLAPARRVSSGRTLDATPRQDALLGSDYRRYGGL